MGTIILSTPGTFISAMVSPSTLPIRSATTMMAPSLAAFYAHAFPIPEFLPVINTTLFSNFFTAVNLLLCCIMLSLAKN